MRYHSLGVGGTDGHLTRSLSPLSRLIVVFDHAAMTVLVMGAMRLRQCLLAVSGKFGQLSLTTLTFSPLFLSTFRIAHRARPRARGPRNMNTHTDIQRTRQK